MLPGRGQARALEDAEERGFADVESLLEGCGTGLGPGVPLTAEFAGSVLDRRAFRGVFGTGPVGGEERVDIWVASEVSDNDTDGADMELEPLGELVGGRAFVEVSAADLVAALHWGIGVLEQAREFLGASHRC